MLTRLHRHPGASQSELADLMEIERASAGRMIDRMEANGWVERRAANGDRRVKRVYLTAEAEQVHRRIWRVAEATVEDALGDLSAQEARAADEPAWAREKDPGARKASTTVRPATAPRTARPRGTDAIIGSAAP